MIYNAEEIYEIGIEIEKNGKAFYEAAAEKTEDPDIKKFLNGLAVWEDDHITLFENLRSELSGRKTEESAFDPDNEAHLYMKAAAESHVFKKSLNVSSILDGCNSTLDYLNIALQFEKDSVVLYNTMVALVPENLGKNKVEKLINEELKHVAMLHEKIENLP